MSPTGGLFETVKKKGEPMAKYGSVNGQWPDGTNDGRDIIPTLEEAMSGAKRLYRVAMGKPFRGTMKATSGRRHTWIRRHVFYVNPNEKRWAGSSINGGWHEIVHSISHMAARRLYREGHGPRHAWIEKQLIAHVVRSGWLDGKLKREPREAKLVDPKAEKLVGIEARIKRWQAKQKRAQTALRKLERQLKYYERRAQTQTAPEGAPGPL